MDKMVVVRASREQAALNKDDGVLHDVEPVERLDVPVGPGKHDYIHTLLCGSKDKPPLVMAPGYAAGIGFYYRNFSGLAPYFRIMAMDWLGTGLSGRPDYKPKEREGSESFFIESLRAWKTKMGLGKMILMGHSLGGYLSACYALKYPEDVQHLILVCPAGVPQIPEDWHQKFLDKQSGVMRRTFFRTLKWAWDEGLTPGSVIRTIGPMGPRLINKYVSARFQGHGWSCEEEKAAFGDYMYQILAAPGSGEHALKHLLAVGAWAHSPLENRLHELKVPVTFIYGKEDWMRPEHAVQLCQRLETDRPRKMETDLKVEIIGDAGHFVFLEQPELFNRAVVDACSPYLGPAAAEAAAASMKHAVEQSHSVDASEWKFEEGSNRDAESSVNRKS